MFRLIAADIYKMFHKKSFYFCLFFSIFFAVLEIYLVPLNIKRQFHMKELPFDLSMLGYNGLAVCFQGVGAAFIFLTILSSIFFVEDFSDGTIKNLLVRGVNRSKIYISKVLMFFGISLLFYILTMFGSFAMGTYLWGVGTFEQTWFLNQLRGVGLQILVDWSIFSLFSLIAVLIRNGGIVMGVNLAIVFLQIPLFICLIISSFISYAFNYSISLTEYWIMSLKNYSFTQFGFSGQGGLTEPQIKQILIISGCYLLFSIVVSLVTFNKRDVS